MRLSLFINFLISFMKDVLLVSFKSAVSIAVFIILPIEVFSVGGEGESMV